MIRLSREVRFSLTPEPTGKVRNSWAGWPSTNRLVPYLVLRGCLVGRPDPVSGYVCNIQTFDRLLREILVQQIIPGFQGRTAEQLLTEIWRAMVGRWQETATIASMTLALSPHINYSIHKRHLAVDWQVAGDRLPAGPTSDSQDDRRNSNPLAETMIVLTQQFEFSAAHRLHCDRLSEEENRALFGKCNNPQGHGHNYVVEVSISGVVHLKTGQLTDLHQFESTVKRAVIDRLDHKHLNRDVEYFAQLNPSVENIATAIWGWLAAEMGETRLDAVRVYETPKTWAEYRGPRGQ